MTDLKALVKASSAAVAKAEGALRSATGELARMEAERDELTRRIEGHDGDDEALDQMIEARSRAAAVIENRRGRVERARMALSEAREGLRVAQRDRLSAEFTRRRDALAVEEDAITEASREFLSRITARIGAHRDEVDAMRRLEADLEYVGGKADRPMGIEPTSWCRLNEQEPIARQLDRVLEVIRQRDVSRKYAEEREAAARARNALSPAERARLEEQERLAFHGRPAQSTSTSSVPARRIQE